MDRRKSIKTIIVGTVGTLSAGALVEACNPGEEKKNDAPKVLMPRRRQRRTG